MGHDLTSHIKTHMPLKEYYEKYHCDLSSVISAAHRKRLSEITKALIKAGKLNVFTSTNNPGINHGGKLSPFSKSFVGYKNLSDEEKLNKIHETALKSVETANNNHNNTTRLDYYTSRGASLEEAEQLLKERQATFSLKICIDKYGFKEGCKRFKERQELWRHSITSNPESNARQIAGRIKATNISLNKQSSKELSTNFKHTVFSKVSQEFFNLLMLVLKQEHNIEFPDVRYAAVNSEYKVVVDEEHFRLLDFYIPSLNKAIEFDGTYWHDDPIADKDRERLIENVMPGIKFHRVAEADYYDDPYNVICKAIDFILEK